MSYLAKRRMARAVAESLECRVLLDGVILNGTSGSDTFYARYKPDTDTIAFYVNQDPDDPSSTPVENMEAGAIAYVTISDTSSGSATDTFSINVPGCSFALVNADSNALSVSVTKGTVELKDQESLATVSMGSAASLSISNGADVHAQEMDIFGDYSQDGGSVILNGAISVGCGNNDHGTFELTAGSLSASDAFFGDFGQITLTQTGGTASFGHTEIGCSTSLTSTVEETGGTFSATDLYLGLDGVLNYHLGGTASLSAAGEHLGLSGGNVAFMMDGGSNTGGLELGSHNGAAVYSQSAGTTTTTGMALGFWGGTGTLNFSGGILTGSGQTILGGGQSTGTGTINQTGGSATLVWLIDGYDGETGQYNLSAGTLTTGQVNLSLGGSGTFNQTGGHHVDNSNIYAGGNAGTVSIYNLGGGSLHGPVFTGGSGQFDFSNGSWTTGSLDGLTSIVNQTRSGTHTMAVGASFTNSDQAPDYSESVITWGDGLSNALSVTATSAGGSVLAQHAYAKPGLYHALLKVTDANGAIAEDAFDVLILPTTYSVIAGGSFDWQNANTYSTRPQIIKVAFSSDVSASLTASDLSLEAITGNEPDPIATSESWDAATNTATFTLAGSTGLVLLPDGNYRATLSRYDVSDSTGAGLAQDVVVDFFVLAGDANRSHTVDNDDQNLVVNNYGASEQDFSEGDFNYDSTVNVADLGIIATNFGKTLPSPPSDANEITAGNQSTTSIELNWLDSQPGAQGYRIQYSDDGENFATLVSLNRNDSRLTINGGDASFTDTGLSEATRRWYRVRAFGDDLDTAYTPKSPASTQTAAPTLVSMILSATNSAYTLNWTNNSAHTLGTLINVGKYDSNGNLHLLNSYEQSGLSSSYVYTPEAGSGRYAFMLATESETGTSPWTNWLEYTPAPAAPTNLTVVSTTDSAVNLSWADNSNNESGFKILESSSPNGTYNLVHTTAANVTTYSDPEAEGTAYYYEVVAYSTGGDSAASNSISGHTRPKAPTNLTATYVSSTEIDLNWTNHSAIADGYYYEISTDQSTWTDLSAAGTTTNSAKVSWSFNSSQTYYFRAYAYQNSGYHSTFSNTSTATTPAFPASPYALSVASYSDSAVNLAWIDASNNETGFKILKSLTRDGNYNEVGSVAANVTTYSDPEPEGSGFYYYEVVSTNLAGNSPPSSYTYGHTKPKAPTALTATYASATEIDLQWVNHSSAATSYFVYQSTDGHTWSVILSGNDNTVESGKTSGTLLSNTTYHFAVNYYVDGYYSAAVYSPVITTPTFPTAPSGLGVTSTTDSTVNLSWTDNSSDETGFTILKSTTGNDDDYTVAGTVGPNVTSFSDTEPELVGIYYKVAASNGGNDSPPSNRVYTHTLPKPPTPLSATYVSPTEIDLSWSVNSAFSNNTYSITQSTDGVTWNTSVGSVHGNATTTLAAIGPFSSTQAYYFRIRAYSADGYLSYAYWPAVTTPSFLAPPSGLVATLNSDNSVTLNWSDNSNNETGFKILRDDGATGAFSVVGSVGANTTTYNDTTADGLEIYKIVATNAAGNSAASNTVSVPLPPKAPSDLIATYSSSSEIDLAWTNHDPNVTSYYIYESTDNVHWTNNVGYVSGSTAHTALIPGPFSNTGVYYFEVKAFGASFSSPSNILRFSLVVPVVTLSPVSNATEAVPLTVTSTTSAIPPADPLSYSWQILDNGRIYAPPASVTTNGSSLTFAPTEPGSWSIVSMVTDLATSRSGTATTGDFLVGEAAPTISIHGAALASENVLYKVDLQAVYSATASLKDKISKWAINWGDGSTAQDLPGSSSVATHFFAPGVSHPTISATATDSYGTYSVPETLSVGVVPAAASNAVAPDLARGDDDTLSWNDNSQIESGFDIKYSTDGQTYATATTAGASATSCSLDGLDLPSVCFLEVIAYDTYGDATPSNPTLYQSGSSTTDPDSSPNVTLTSPPDDLLEGQDATLTATATPAASGDSLMYEWSLEANGLPDPSYSEVVTDSPSLDFTPDAAGDWSATLTVIDVADDTSSSDSKDFSVDLAQAPQISGSLASDGTVNLKWTDIDDEEGFELQKKLNDGSWTTLDSPGAGTLTDTDNLDDGSTADYRIRGVYASNYSSYSDPLEIASAPKTPTNVALAWNVDSTATVSWSAGSSQSASTSYKVSRSTDGVNFSAVGTTQDSSYTDKSVPDFTSILAYRITAINSAGSAQSLPAGLRVIDSVTVPCTGTPVNSNVALTSGAHYEMRASGELSIGTPTDAEFSYYNNQPYDFQYGGDPVDYGIAINQTSPGSLKNTRWGSYNEHHIYQTKFTGTGGTASFTFWDNNYADNSGSLNVKILSPFVGLVLDDHSASDNAVAAMVNASSSSTLYVPANSNGTATLDLSSLAPSFDASGSPSITWTISGDGASPTSGSLTQTASLLSLTPGAGNGIYLLTAVLGSDQAQMSVHVMPSIITAKTIHDGAVVGDLATDKKQSTGVFLPIDNGDYDYDGKLDDDEGGPNASPPAPPPAADDRLLPIVLHGTGDSDSHDYYTLTIPTGIRVWQDKANNGVYSQVTGSSRLQTQNDRTLYLEGVSSSNAGSLVIDWQNGLSGYASADTLKVSVFNMSGALNVPAGGTYVYNADLGLLPASASWSGVSGSPGTMTPVLPGLATSVTWGTAQAAAVGKVELTVNDSYTWAIDVNVVQFTFTQNTITYGGPPGPTQGYIGPLQTTIDGDPSGLTQAVKWSALITKSGPTVGSSNVMRGLRFVNVGFIQNVQLTQNNAVVETLNQNGIPVVRNVSSRWQNNQWYVDTETSLPWYDKPTKGAANKAVSLLNSDRPKVDVCDSKTSPRSCNLLFSGRIFICAQTENSYNDADHKYVPIAEGSWHFNGSGTYTGDTWAPVAGVTGNGGDANFNTQGPFDTPVLDGTTGTYIVQNDDFQ